MKKILCPTDFSDAAHGAIAYAAKLAQATNGELTLLHVQSMFDVIPVEIMRSSPMTIREIAERLEYQSREVTKAFKVSCHAEVKSGFSKLSSVIRDKGKDFDLIVMGSDGPDDLYQFFAGSNTYNASKTSDIPLLIIPSGYVYVEIKKIIYAYDYLSERNLPLARLIPWIKALNCELTVLQVMEEAYSKEAEDDLKELQFIIRTMIGHELKCKYDTIRSSDIAQAINSYMIRTQPDALALCSIHRNLVERIFHKSIIRRISAICNYPVFVFHR
ncbi:MAG TPA: universal stress protein [Chryseosolibacter sp.]|jgi:nucleotide-binding universal stress UspA family protein|nr:universal stress protein [Chryseosolibacter sp.]